MLILASDLINIMELNTTLNRNTFHYLKSPNFGDSPDDSANDDNTTCVVTPTAEQSFTISVMYANAFPATAEEFTTGRLDVYGVTANGQAEAYRPLARAGLTALRRTRQSVNYAGLLYVSLESVRFTYSKGQDDLSFIMQLQGI